MASVLVDQVAAHAEREFEATLDRLKAYLTTPAISCDREHHADVKRLARQIEGDLQQLGFSASVRELPGALPLVFAERRSTSTGVTRVPTLLIYGHLDLQPVKGENWRTPPHQATVIDGRLYARGAADDMGGWVSHLAALQAWLSVADDLPLHVKLIIESEEEIGSPNLERYMDQWPELFEADVMVLTDCENPSTEIPGLTVSLRGIYEVDVVCEALTADIHSGLWGNAVPDPGNALIKLLSRLIDDDTRFCLGRQTVPETWAEQAAAVPLSESVVREGARLVDAVSPLPLHGRPTAEWLWRQPAITVLSTTFPRLEERKNAVRSQVSATLSLRVAPGQTARDLRQLLEATLLREVPGGVRVELRDHPVGAESWLYEPRGPAFAAADRAYAKVWGRPLLPIGVGGSIPFVALFGRRYSELPLILNGVMDPLTGAHGPNESLDLGVFKKAILSNVYLYDELARVAY